MMNKRWMRFSAFALFAIATALQAETGTIRVRFVNGKNGKPLHVKNMQVGTGGFQGNGYTVERVETDGLTVTFHDVTTFTFENAAYYRCDAKRESDPPVTFSLAEVLAKGQVAPNFCGSFHAQPEKGELVLYSRKARFWESLGNLRGLFICA